MTAKQLIVEFKKAGGEIVAENNEIFLEAPLDLDPKLKTLLLENRDEIRDIVTSKEIVDWDEMEDLVLEEMKRLRQPVKVHSVFLGEDIWVVPTELEFSQTPGPEAVYTVSEIQEFNSLSKNSSIAKQKELFRKINKFKKVFKGQVISIDTIQ